MQSTMSENKLNDPEMTDSNKSEVITMNRSHMCDRELARFWRINKLLLDIRDSNYRYEEHLADDLRELDQLLDNGSAQLAIGLFNQSDILALKCSDDDEPANYTLLLGDMRHTINTINIQYPLNSSLWPQTTESVICPDNVDSGISSPQGDNSNSLVAKKMVDSVRATLNKHEQNVALEDAIIDNEIVKGLLALKRGANINFQTKSLKRTFLHAVIDALHKHGKFFDTNADNNSFQFVNRDDEDSDTNEENGNEILLVNGKLDLFSVLEFLLRLPDYKLLQDKYGQTPLHVLVKPSDFNFTIYRVPHLANDIHHITSLMIKNRSWQELNCTNTNGVTAFMSSIMHNTVAASTILARAADVDVNLCAMQDCKVIHYTNHLVAKKLWNRAAYVWGGQRLERIVIPEKFTPIMACCLFNNREVLDELMGRQDLNGITDVIIPCTRNSTSFMYLSPETDFGDTHLHFAVLNNNLELLKYMLNKLGPQSLNNCVNNSGLTILHLACTLKRKHIIHFLLCKAQLAAIFDSQHNMLDNKDYCEFVNRLSRSGNAARMFYTCPVETFHWKHSKRLYRAFVECIEYDVSAVDNLGTSLLHIIVDKGLVGLMTLAIKLRKLSMINFIQPDGIGRIPLQLAIESGSRLSPTIIREMAALAHEYDIDFGQNQLMLYMPRLSKALANKHDLNFFGVVIENMGINDLVNIYSQNKPKSFWAIFSGSKFEIDVRESGTLVSMEQKDLIDAIKNLLHFSHIETSTSLNTNFKLKEKYPTLYKSIKAQYYGKSEKGTIEFEYKKKKWQVTYTLNNQPQESQVKRYKVDVTYNDIIKMIGEEWDYMASSETKNAYHHPNSYIFQSKKTPFLQLILAQVKANIDSGLEMDMNLSMSKLKAFLAFPYIEIEQTSNALQQLTNPLEHAPNEDVRKLLEIKLETQKAELICTDTIDDEPVNGELPNFTIDYEDIPKKVNPEFYKTLADGFKEIKMSGQTNVSQQIYSTDAKLYIFAKLFCQRLQSPRKNFEADYFLRILDSMARLLEVDSVCTAIVLRKNKFYIASNFGEASCDHEMRENIKKNVISAAEHVFKYVTSLASDKTSLCTPVERNELKEILKHVLARTVILKLAHYKTFKNIFPNTEEETLDKMVSLLNICFSQNNDFYKVACKDLIGELRFHDNPNFIFCSCGEIQINKCTDNPCSRCGNSEKQILKASDLTLVFRLCRDIHKLRAAVKSRIPGRQLPPHLLTALVESFKSREDGKDMFQVLENPDGIHAECILVSYILSLKDKETNIHVGISKICCPHCALFIQTLRNRSYDSDVPFFYTRGSHQSNYFWRVPRLLVDDNDNLAKFLGGRHSKLYTYFAKLTNEERIMALNIVQHFEYSQLKKLKLYNLATNPRNTNTYILHSKPEQSLTLVSTLDTCEYVDDDIPEEKFTLDQQSLLLAAIYHLNADDLFNLFNSNNYCEHVNYPHPITGQTALHVAVMEDHLELVTLLIGKGAITDISDKSGLTPVQYLGNYATSKNMAMIWDILHPEVVQRRNLIHETRQKYLDRHPETAQFQRDQWGNYYTLGKPNELEFSPYQVLQWMIKSIHILQLNLFGAKINDHIANSRVRLFTRVDSSFLEICYCVSRLIDSDNRRSNQMSETRNTFTLLANALSYTNSLEGNAPFSYTLLDSCLKSMQDTGELETLREELSTLVSIGSPLHMCDECISAPTNLFVFINHQMYYYNTYDIASILQIYDKALKPESDGATTPAVALRRAMLLNACLQIGTIARSASPGLRHCIEPKGSQVQGTLAIRYAIVNVHKPHYDKAIRSYLTDQSATLHVDDQEIDPQMIIQYWIASDFDKILSRIYLDQKTLSPEDVIKSGAEYDGQWGIDYRGMRTKETMIGGQTAPEVVPNDLTESLSSAEPNLGTFINNVSSSENGDDEGAPDLFCIFDSFIFYAQCIERLLESNPKSDPSQTASHVRRHEVEPVEPLHFELELFQILAGGLSHHILQQSPPHIPEGLVKLLKGISNESKKWLNYDAKDNYMYKLDSTKRQESYFIDLFRNCKNIVTASSEVRMLKFVIEYELDYEEACRIVRRMVCYGAKDFFEQLKENNARNQER